MANQLCVQIMVLTSGLFDIVDVSNLQRYVIQEFRRRHEWADNYSKENDLSEKEAKRARYKKLNHFNMQSA